MYTAGVCVCVGVYNVQCAMWWTWTHVQFHIKYNSFVQHRIVIAFCMAGQRTCVRENEEHSRTGIAVSLRGLGTYKINKNLGTRPSRKEICTYLYLFMEFFLLSTNTLWQRLAQRWRSAQNIHTNTQHWITDAPSSSHIWILQFNVFMHACVRTCWWQRVHVAPTATTIRIWKIK